jgi:hypothetical protein
MPNPLLSQWKKTMPLTVFSEKFTGPKTLILSVPPGTGTLIHMIGSCFFGIMQEGKQTGHYQVSTTGASNLKLFEFSVSADGDTLYKTWGDGWKTKHLAWDTVIEINGESFSAAGYSVYDDEKRLNITANYPCGSIKVTIAPETVFAVDTEAAAQSAIAIADKLIAAIDSKRAEPGAAQNSPKSAIRNQSNAAENLETARSRIRGHRLCRRNRRPGPGKYPAGSIREHFGHCQSFQRNDPVAAAKLNPPDTGIRLLSPFRKKPSEKDRLVS